MKKWLITLVILFVALAAAAATIKFRWAPIFGPKNDHLYDQVGLLLAAMGLIVMVMTLRVAIKQLKQNESSKKSIQAGRDVNQAGGNIQTGGITTNAPVGSDVFQGVKVGRDQINVEKAFFGTQTPPIASLHQLPPPPRDFTGREVELEELLGKLKEGGISISGLRGMGGIGKTALALVLADRLAPDYPDGQFYLDLKGTKEKGAKPLTPADAMAHVIRGYYPDAKLPEDDEELRSLYNSVLHGKRALLLMDNALDDKQVEPLIPPDGNVLLITSRQHFHLSGIFPKDLNTLRPADAKELLLKIAPNIGTCADEIAKLCGYLPFALLNAGGALVDQHIITPAEYAERLTEAKKRLELVDASLSLSYDLLDAEMQKFWRMLAVFPDTFDSAAAAAVWEIPQEEADEKLNTLINRSLVDCDETSHRCRLHDLARVFADSRLTDKKERYETQKRHAEYYKNVLEAAGALYLEGGEATTRGLALFDLEYANIHGGHKWSADYWKNEPPTAKLCSDYLILKSTAYLLNLRQHAAERITWLEASLRAARQIDNRADEVKHLGNIGAAYWALNNHTLALDFLRQQLEGARAIGDKHSEGNALGNIGLVYQDLGEHDKAIEYYEMHLSIAQEIDDWLGMGNEFCHLAVANRSLNNINKSLEFCQKAFQIYRKDGVNFRAGEADALFNMSLALDELGQRKEAIAKAEAALDIYKQIGDPYAAKAREWVKGKR